LGLLLPLLFLMLFMGVYPRVFLDRSQPSIAVIKARVNQRPAGGSYTTAELEELRRLRRENAELRRANDRDLTSGASRLTPPRSTAPGSPAALPGNESCDVGPGELVCYGMIPM